MKTIALVIILAIAAGTTLSACGESAQEKLARQQLEAQEKDRQQTNIIREQRRAAEESIIREHRK